jgi:hypothetical protein
MPSHDGEWHAAEPFAAVQVVAAEPSNELYRW